jgi:hypothetical protein
VGQTKIPGYCKFRDLRRMRLQQRQLSLIDVLLISAIQGVETKEPSSSRFRCSRQDLTQPKPDPFRAIPNIVSLRQMGRRGSWLGGADYLLGCVADPPSCVRPVRPNTALSPRGSRATAMPPPRASTASGDPPRLAPR